jgi:hypothetical protein
MSFFTDGFVSRDRNFALTDVDLSTRFPVGAKPQKKIANACSNKIPGRLSLPESHAMAFVLERRSRNC